MPGMKPELPAHVRYNAIIAKLEAGQDTGTPLPGLLLHSCCAPCSTSVIERLSPHFLVTVYYYNPNIDERDEYAKRAAEQQTLLERMTLPNPVNFVAGEYRSEVFLSAVAGHEADREGGTRCGICYALRLDETAKKAKELSIPWFCTTLSVSPLKDTRKINALGEAVAGKYGVSWLYSDFKKGDGFKRSVELSAFYALYRQAWCGCSFSRRDSVDRT